MIGEEIIINKALHVEGLRRAPIARCSPYGIVSYATELQGYVRS